MLLAVDVGNTNLTFGIFNGEELRAQFTMTTKIQRTADEYGLMLINLLSVKKITPDKIEDVIISSVVPTIMRQLNEGIRRYLHRTPILVGTGTRTGIRVSVANPKEIGADRIVDAVAAYAQYGGPVLVIDFGTATTYDLISEQGCFVAGITAPGILICANALWNETARLPEIEIEKPDSILAKDTITSMQAGLVYGYIGQTEYIIRKVREEAGLEQMKVVATGGLGQMLSKEIKLIDTYDPELTLKGLRLIYHKNKE
jgi:type III pantothenate kinase